MDFPRALSQVKDGEKFTRQSWFKGTFVMAVYTPYKKDDWVVFFYPINGVRLPWNPTQNDMFAEDWVAYED